MGIIFSSLKNTKKSALELKQTVHEIKHTLVSIRQLLSGVVNIVQDVEEISRELRITICLEAEKVKESMGENIQLILTAEEEICLYHLEYYDEIVKVLEQFFQRVLAANIKHSTRLMLVTETIKLIRNHVTALKKIYHDSVDGQFLDAIVHYLSDREVEMKRACVTVLPKNNHKQWLYAREQTGMFCAKEALISNIMEGICEHLEEKVKSINIVDIKHFLEIKSRLKAGYPTTRKNSESTKRKEYLRKVKGVLSKTVRSARKLNPNDDFFTIAKNFDVDLKKAAQKVQITEQSFHGLQTEFVSSLKQAREREESQKMSEQCSASSLDDVDSTNFEFEDVLTCSDASSGPDVPVKDGKKISELTEELLSLNDALCKEKVEDLLQRVESNYDLISSLLTRAEPLETEELWRSIETCVGAKLDQVQDNRSYRQHLKGFTNSGRISHSSKSLTGELEEGKNSSCNHQENAEVSVCLLSAIQKEPNGNKNPDSSDEAVQKISKHDTNGREFEEDDCHYDDASKQKRKDPKVLERLLSPENISGIIRMSMIDLPKSAVALQQFRTRSEMIHLSARLLAPIVHDLTSGSPNVVRFYSEDGSIQTLTFNTLYEVLKLLESNYCEDDCIKRAATKAAKKQLLLPFCRYLREIAVDTILM